MLGYIKPDKMELKVRELETYSAYYCGLCKEVGELYGQVSRFWLSNDMAFLALFLAGLTGGEDHVKHEHCIVHPIGKRPVETGDQAIKYAADMMMVLVCENYMDDVRDGERSKMYGRLLGIARKYEKSANAHPQISKVINDSLSLLYEYEQPGKANVNDMAAAFGKMMQAVFLGFPLLREQREAVAVFAENLGKWLYVIDMLDDFDEDMKKGQYNPLLDLGFKTREQAKAVVEKALYYYLDEMIKGYDLIQFKKNKGIIDNIVYLGIRRITEDVLEGREVDKKNDKRSL